MMETAYLECLERLNLREIPEARRAAIDRLVSEFNPLTGQVETVSGSLRSSGEVRYFEITLYRRLGGRTDSLSAKLDSVPRGGERNHEDRALSMAAATRDAVTRQVRQVEEISGRIREKLRELGLTADSDASWSIVQDLLRNQVPGLNAGDLCKRVFGGIRRPRANEAPHTLDRFRAELSQGLGELIAQQVPRVDLRPELFEGSPPPHFVLDTETVLKSHRMPPGRGVATPG
jgi:hypothetical protein